MSDVFKEFFSELTNFEVWDAYALSIDELKRRGLIRTRNIVGERGEFLAIETYDRISGLPNLQAAPEGTQNVDAISRKGERYSIKTITQPSKTTGVFYGCGNLGDDNIPSQKFEYAIVVVIGNDFQLKNMYELTWNQFLIYKKWHKTMRAWNLSLTKNFVENVKQII